MIYSPTNDKCVWRISYNNELHMLWIDLDIVNVIKIRRLRWQVHLFRLQEMDPCRKFTVLKSEGTRHVGKSELRWFELVEGDLKKMGVKK
jgi:hypothetical protein